MWVLHDPWLRQGKWEAFASSIFFRCCYSILHMGGKKDDSQHVNKKIADNDVWKPNELFERWNMVKLQWSQVVTQHTHRNLCFLQDFPGWWSRSGIFWLSQSSFSKIGTPHHMQRARISSADQMHSTYCLTFLRVFSVKTSAAWKPCAGWF